MLVAGRRGGKTLSAAWETIYYALHPEVFHWDVHRVHSSEPLHIWVLVPNFKSSGRAAMNTLRKVMREAGLEPNRDYKWNRSENIIEFTNGTYLEFKTAEQADQLIGAGIDILWIDEAGAIPTQEAYDYASPALDDRLGIVWCTSTPRGKNWWYELFWGPRAQEDTNVGTVEYRSCDNPHFPKERWLYRKATYHPLLFKQEFMAAFDSMAGKALSGEWLSYYELDELPRKDEQLPLMVAGQLNVANLDLNIYIGIDPAISQASTADRFAAVVLGVSKTYERVFVLDVIADRIPFPEQIDLLKELHVKWRPQMIAVESVAFQAAIHQQAIRLPGMVPTVPILNRGKKEPRIMAMGPVFKLGRVLIRTEFNDFVDEWLDYDPELKHPKDDVLDATEIALSVAGILLPGMPEVPEERPAASIEELAHREVRSLDRDWMRGGASFDEDIGEW
jgi:predicted phage terminase large subunit-like protein